MFFPVPRHSFLDYAVSSALVCDSGLGLYDTFTNPLSKPAEIDPYFLAGVLPIAFAAVVLMTLPYSVLMGLLSEEYHGAAAGLYGFGRGVGTLVGPLIAGIAIQLLQPVNLLVFSETKGYVAMFPVASVFLFASIPLLRSTSTEGNRAQR